MTESPTRLTILIGCPGRGKSKLEGVMNDIDNLYRYHQTPRGGGWHREELLVLIDPTRKEVLEIVGGVRVDFLRVCFSGHGRMESVIHETRGLVEATGLELKHGQLVYDLELINPWIRKQEFILDCCRKLPRGAAISGIPQTLADIPFTFREFLRARRLMDQFIQLSPAGSRFVYAASANQFAGDTLSGGAFTLALLGRALNGAPSCVDSIFGPGGQNWNRLFIDGPIGIDTLICQVSADLKRAGRTQQPEIVEFEGNLTVPFAVNTQWPAHRLENGNDLIRAQGPPRSELIRRADSAKGILTMGAMLLGAWLVNEVL